MTREEFTVLARKYIICDSTDGMTMRGQIAAELQHEGRFPRSGETHKTRISEKGTIDPYLPFLETQHPHTYPTGPPIPTVKARCEKSRSPIRCDAVGRYIAMKQRQSEMSCLRFKFSSLPPYLFKVSRAYKGLVRMTVSMMGVNIAVGMVCHDFQALGFPSVRT